MNEDNAPAVPEEEPKEKPKGRVENLTRRGKGRPKGSKNKPKAKLARNLAQRVSLKVLRKKVKANGKLTTLYEAVLEDLILNAKEPNIRFQAFRFGVLMGFGSPPRQIDPTPKSATEESVKNFYIPEDMTEEEWADKASQHFDEIQSRDDDTRN